MVCVSLSRALRPHTMTITQKYLDDIVFDPRFATRKPINRYGSDGYSVSCPFCGSKQKTDWKKRNNALPFFLTLPIRLTFSNARDAMRQCDLKNSLRNLIMHYLKNISGIDILLVRQAKGIISDTPK